MTIPSSQDLLSELVFSTSRSSGPGGQNVNKVNSKVILKFNPLQSSVLTDEQKEIFQKKMGSQLTKDGWLIIAAQESRSQLQNKEDALQKLNAIFVRIFTPQKKRKATKPSKTAKLKRLETKKQHSEKKKWRKNLE